MSGEIKTLKQLVTSCIVKFKSNTRVIQLLGKLSRDRRVSALKSMRELASCEHLRLSDLN